MRRIVAAFFISLDGVVESPDQWHFPYFDEAMGNLIGESVNTSTGVLMGRRLYDEWSQFWPAQGPEIPFTEFINATPKYVLTHRPVDGEVWNNTTPVTGDDAAAQVRALKAEGEGEITMSGSAETVRWLIAEGLLDELNLLVHPIAVGKGQRLFEDTGTVPLKLTHSATLPTGVLHLKYAIEPAADGSADPATQG